MLWLLVFRRLPSVVPHTDTMESSAFSAVRPKAPPWMLTPLVRQEEELLPLAVLPSEGVLEEELGVA